METKKRVVEDYIESDNEPLLSFESNADSRCLEQHDGYTCTRTMGHDGKCAANSGPKWQHATWKVRYVVEEVNRDGDGK